jgi:integrase
MAQAAAAGMTVQRLIDAYAEHLKAKRLRSAPAMERTLRREVVPVIGRVSLAELHRRDINRVTDAILARGKNVAACRCFTIMHGLFSWSVGRGDFEHNPMEKMNRPPVDYTPRQRVLAAAEIRTLWHGLAGFAHERVLKLCLATGCRVGEAAGLPRAELDLAAKTWTLPAARSKNKCEHTLPLSSLALEIIEGYAFDNPSPAKIARDMGGLPARLGLEHLTSHDLRRTCADHLSELGVDQITIGHVLNHRSITRASVTQRHYVVRTYLPEMARALEVWADRLRTIIQGDGA